MFRPVSAGLVGACSGMENLSRGRHGCVFEGAERDGLWKGWARRGNGVSRLGSFGCVASWKPPTRSAWPRLRCCKVGYAPASLGGARRGAVVFGELWKPPSCGHGGRSTRPWWDVMRRVEESWCEASWVAERRVVFWHQTTPVQARFPIDAGGVGFVGESPGEASRCGLSRVTSWNQARAGTGPDQRRRLGMDSGGPRFSPARCGRLSSGWLCCVLSWLGLAALVIGTKPLRRGGAEWKGFSNGTHP